MKTCGEVLVEILENYGIDTVFGIPGVHTVELYRGLPNTKIRHITPRHEQGAGFMADGYARAGGRPYLHGGKVLSRALALPTPLNEGVLS